MSNEYNPKEHPKLEKSLDKYLAQGGKGGFHSFRMREKKQPTSDGYMVTKGGLTGRVKVPEKYIEKMKEKDTVKRTKDLRKKMEL